MSTRPSALTSKQRALLDVMRRKDSSRSYTIPAVRRDGPVALSLSQARLWVLHQLEAESAFYTMAQGTHLEGDLDEEALAASLREIVKRHDVLRTRFETRDAAPVAVVQPDVGFDMDRLDVRGLSEDGQRLELARAKAHIGRRFDLCDAPLLRAALVRLAEKEWILLRAWHHIVADGWSSSVMAREMAALYKTFREGRPSPLRPLGLQYADYAEWQRARLTPDVLDSHVAYWKAQLAGLPPLIDLPTDRPRPTIDRYRGDVVRVDVSSGIAGALKAIARDAGATLFMTLLAAFKVLLWRYSRCEDVVVGVPVANRGHQDLEALVGFFVNLLVLRTDLRGDPSFLELVGRVRQVALDAYAHQEMPFELLVERVNPQRSRSYHPLFQVMFALRANGHPSLQLEGVTATPIDVAAETAKVDLSLDLKEAEGRLAGTLRYNSDLYDRDTAERVVRHWYTLLQAIAANPAAPVGELPLMGDIERHQVLVEWNDTSQDAPFAPVHRRFEAQAARTPDAIAVRTDTRCLTYRDLNESANTLAHYLLKNAALQTPWIPVLAPGGVEIARAFLAVMKAGAAVVPIDPQWPDARIREALDALPASVVLLTEPMVHRSCAPVRYRAIPVDGPGAGGDCARNPDVEVTPDTAVYAMYTSGSTGRPKAAGVAHRGLSNRFGWMDAYFGRRAPISLQTTQHFYDSAMWELFWPLSNGGSVIMPSSHLDLTAEALVGLIERHGVTILDMVPAVLRNLVDMIEGDTRQRSRIATLRHVVVGGEELAPSTAARLRRLCPRLRLTNLYGPTEASIGCIHHRVGTAERRIPIGRPISNVAVLILDERLRPVPIGVVGEICLSGACLGIGYVGDDARTREVFVDNPIPEVGSRQIYRTGDLGRFRGDGAIEYVGRRDRQVKLRGHRIELEEVETVLARHPEIREAAATIVASDTRGASLVAVVATHDADTTLTDQQLKAFVRSALPEYMVPSRCVMVTRLPVMASGKLDRAALASIVAAQPEQNLAPARSMSRTEELVAGVWREVLGRSDVRPDESFFDVGGNSMLAAVLVSRVRQACGVTLSAAAVFSYSTIAQLSEHIDAEAERDPGVHWVVQ